MFTILSHLDQLVPVEGKSTATTGEYYCPLCNAENFKVDLKTGKYNAFGCDCNTSEAGKKAIIEAIAPSTWQKPPRPASNQTFTYDRLVNGVAETIAQVVRSDDGQGKRQFYQQHWDGRAWAKGLPDDIKAQVRLYRIFRPVNERAKGDRIFLVEGEGKVDALLKLGIPATCAIGGAGKWKQYGHPNYLEDLKGYQVVLCPDRDEPGLKHCEEVEADLVDHGIDVAGWLYAYPDSYLWQRLPKAGGADVADWIADGATRDDILGAIEPRRVAQPAPEPAGDQSFELEERHCSMRVNYHRVKQQLGDRLRFNQLTKGIELDGEALDVDDLQVSLAVNYNIQAPDAQFLKIVGNIARENAYSPVVEYLDQAHSAHGHSTAILDDLSTRYFGTDHPLHNSYLRKTLIAAVARAYQPGCKVDTACILQGRQGALKSSFFKVLASEAWFDDSLGNASDKDERLKLHMVWFVEWAELETVFKRKDVATVKAFLSSSRDLVRPPYGRTVQEFDRPSIIVGTTNEVEFLTDPTGSRRYWVIPVARKIDIAKLQRERDAIWGAAVAAYQSGEAWWLSDNDQVLSEELNQEYAMQDPWHEAVAAYVNELHTPEVSTRQILDNCLHIDLDKQERRTQMRVAGIMKQLGWAQERRQVSGVRERVWTPIDDNQKSFFNDIGWAGRAEGGETVESQEVEACPTSCPTSDSRLGRSGSNGGVYDTPVCQSAQPTQRAQPADHRLGRPEPLLGKGLPDLPNLPDLNDQTIRYFSASPQVGQLVRKAGKSGWRGEIVRMVSPTHVDVLWTGEKHPSLMAIADLSPILDQAHTSTSLNGAR